MKSYEPGQGRKTAALRGSFMCGSLLYTMHEKYMRMALKQATIAQSKDEVPVGAIIVKEGKVIARAHNLRESSQRALAHAEMLAIDKACRKLNTWRLEGCVLYVTLEPCAMCAGASILARLDGVVYGAKDPKAGSMGSIINLAEISQYNHHPWLISGILAEECGQILTDFFKPKRVK